MLFRPCRGGLAEAMAEAVEVKDWAHLCEMVTQINDSSPLPIIHTPVDLAVRRQGYDERIEWDTYIIKTMDYEHNGRFPVGYISEDPVGLKGFHGRYKL